MFEGLMFLILSNIGLVDFIFTPWSLVSFAFEQKQIAF